MECTAWSPYIFPLFLLWQWLVSARVVYTQFFSPISMARKTKSKEVVSKIAFFWYQLLRKTVLNSRQRTKNFLVHNSVDVCWKCFFPSFLCFRCFILDRWSPLHKHFTPTFIVIVVVKMIRVLIYFPLDFPKYFGHCLHFS